MPTPQLVGNASVFTSIEGLTCGDCGIAFGLSATLHAKVKQTGRRFYCPNGHCISYNTTENERLKQEIERQKRMVEQNQRLYESERASHASTKGQVTKLRRRAAAALCPCCSRSFVQLRRHLASKHPDYKP